MLAKSPTLESVLAEYNVEMVELNDVRGPKQTHAGKTLKRIWDRHGEHHMRDVMACLVETDGNDHALAQPIIVATSRVLVAQRAWWERDASAWLTVFDETDLVRLHAFIRLNRKAASPQAAIAQEIYRLLALRFAPERA